MGNQFICLNSVAPIWDLFPSCRQHLTHLFLVVCSFFLKLCVKFGYHAAGIIEEPVFTIQGFYPTINLTHHLGGHWFPWQVFVEDTPQISYLGMLLKLDVSMINRQVAHFFILFLPVKRLHFVLSSPKWILSLLPTNQSHRELKSLFNWSCMTSTFLCEKNRTESSAYSNKSHYMACGISFTYKRKSRGPKMEPWGTPQFISPGSE